MAYLKKKSLLGELKCLQLQSDSIFFLTQRSMQAAHWHIKQTLSSQAPGSFLLLTPACNVPLLLSPAHQPSSLQARPALLFLKQGLGTQHSIQ